MVFQNKIKRTLNSENDAVTLFWPEIQSGHHRYSRVGHIFYIKNKFILKIKLGKWVPVGAQIALFLQKGKMISKTFGFQHLNEKISIANYLKAVSKIFTRSDIGEYYDHQNKCLKILLEVFFMSHDNIKSLHKYRRSINK